MRVRRFAQKFGMAVFGLGTAFAPTLALPAFADDVREMADLSLEELLQVEITSASKHSQPLERTAAASFVITKDDIRRSGATALPEILRMVPGLEVARVATGEWAVTARGFNGVFADTLLVMIDGRTIYTSIFSGTFWDEHDPVLEDINRIEVVRGPGATLWGANAFNGIINIITDDANDSAGELATVTAGDEDRLITAVRHGGSAGKVGYRIYGKFSDRDSARLSADQPAHDSWQTARAGFRADAELDAEQQLTVDAEGLYSQKDWDLRRVAFVPPDFVESADETRYASGGHVRGRWINRLSNTSELTVQSYYDHMTRDDSVLGSRRDTFDIDLQHRFALTQSQNLLSGFGFRAISDSFDSTQFVSVEPETRTYDLYTGFLQDELSLTSDLQLILGTKVEHNAFSGWEVQPNVRTVWAPEQNLALWAAISRAVRSPARFNHDGRLAIAAFPTDAGVDGELTLLGDRSYLSNEVIAYETGVRYAISDSVSTDLALFYNDLDRIDTSSSAGEPLFVDEPAPHVEIPLRISNDAHGESYGAELAFNVRPLSWWRLALAYTYLDTRLTVSPDDLIYSGEERLSPRNQLNLRSMINVTDTIELDSNLRYVDQVGAFQVPAYGELDLRAGWKVNDGLEVSLVGQNLLHAEHPEFVSNFVDVERTSIQRAVYVKASWALDPPHPKK